MENQKLNNLEKQVTDYINWIRVHYHGKKHVLSLSAKERGVGSSDFAMELQKHFNDITEHKIQLELLEWILGEIQHAKET